MEKPDYAPTLGGILRLVQKLEQIGFPMPVFEVDIYSGSEYKGTTYVDSRDWPRPNSGTMADINDLIAVQGPYAEIWDCRLSSRDRLNRFEFAHPEHFPPMPTVIGVSIPTEVVFEGTFSSFDVNEFNKKLSIREIRKIARWGRRDPSWRHLFTLAFLPRSYKYPALA